MYGAAQFILPISIESMVMMMTMMMDKSDIVFFSCLLCDVKFRGHHHERKMRKTTLVFTAGFLFGALIALLSKALRSNNGNFE